MEGLEEWAPVAEGGDGVTTEAVDSSIVEMQKARNDYDEAKKVSTAAYHVFEEHKAASRKNAFFFMNSPNRLFGWH